MLPPSSTIGSQAAAGECEDPGPPRTIEGGAGPEFRGLRVLYLFAGAKRSNDLKAFLTRLCTYTKTQLQELSPGNAINFYMHMDEVDILRGKTKYNLLNGAVRAKIMAKVSSGRYNVVVASPPCSTFSRARSNDGGPSPLRSMRYPRGLPWLRGAAKASVMSSNVLVDFTAAVLRVQAKQGGVIILEHPEDLGRQRRSERRGHIPASIWRWPQVTSLLKLPDVVWGAFYQQDYGTTYRKPTRLLTNLRHPEKIITVGDAKFDTEGYYEGPLVWREAGEVLKGQTVTGSFKTAEAAAWPPGMCSTLADMIWVHFAHLERLTAEFPTVGVDVLKVPSEGDNKVEDDVDRATTMVARAGKRMATNPTQDPKVVKVARQGFNETKDNFRGTRDGDPVMLDYIDDGLPIRSEAVEMDLQAAGMPRHGHGLERMADFMGRPKEYEDGGGLCSPGRWQKEDRGKPTDIGVVIMGKARALLEDSVSKMSDKKDTTISFMMKLAAGRFVECPFHTECVGEMTAFLGDLVGLEAGDCGIAEGQSFRLRLIAALLKMMGDPDWEYFHQLENGVPLGVGVQLPRTPAVYRQKEKWSLEEEAEDAQAEVDNYRSLAGYEAEVKKLFEDEEKLDWMKELSCEEAHQQYGKTLHLAGLAVVVEKDKFRVVHDGTHGVKVNQRIRVQDQVKTPTAGELRALMKERYMDTKGTKQFVLVGDVSKAHRRVKIRQEDWGLQACRLEKGRVWLNCVGTYGIASAGYWWSRLSAALLVRFFYYVLAASGRQDALLFADDLLMVAGRLSEIVDLGALILVWVALGVPWKWQKWRGGHQVGWIGYWVCFETYHVGISAARATWLQDWIRKTVEEGEIQVAEFRAVLGRISFTLGVLDYLKPFVAPLFSWIAAVGHIGRVPIPWSVAFILSFVEEELRSGRRTTAVRPRGISLGTVFRADAKAEGQEIVLGGWECCGGCHPSAARWFRVHLTRQTAPWAFSRGEPFRVIAALELFATLVSLMVFADNLPEDAHSTISLTGHTDNSGNVFALNRLMTSKFPLVVVLTELSAQMRAKRLDLELLWIPRNQNEEADAITNGHTDIFLPSREIKVEVDNLPFLVLGKMVSVADHLYEQVRCRRASKTCAANLGKPGKARPLKERDPW